MVKFTCTDKSGKLLVGFGITKKNVEELKKGRPIHIDGQAIGMPNQNFFIFYGNDEESIYDEIQKVGSIGPNTVLHGVRGAKQ